MSGYGGGGFDNNGGDTPSRGGGGSSDGAKPRRNYDEQTLIPITCKMVHSALGDPSGGSDLTLRDGRPLHMVKLVAAVRNHEERSTNVYVDVEDGTGLVQVKVWVNEGDECSAASNLRRDAATDHTYIRIVGQIREFDGQRQIVANDVRPVSTGNELTHHLLEVAHSYEKHVKVQSDADTMGMNMGMGVGIGKMASLSTPPPPRGGGGVAMGSQGGGGGLDDAVIRVIKTMGREYSPFPLLFFFIFLPPIAHLACVPSRPRRTSRSRSVSEPLSSARPPPTLAFVLTPLSPRHPSLSLSLSLDLTFAFPSHPLTPPTSSPVANSGSGIHVNDIVAQVSSKGGHSAADIKNAINNLSNEGHIYSTIDENHYQYAE